MENSRQKAHIRCDNDGAHLMIPETHIGYLVAVQRWVSGGGIKVTSRVPHICLLSMLATLRLTRQEHYACSLYSTMASSLSFSQQGEQKLQQQAEHWLYSVLPCSFSASAVYLNCFHILCLASLPCALSSIPLSFLPILGVHVFKFISP